MATHRIAWEFLPRPGCIAAFERAYGPDGEWATLFRRAEGYLGTTLTPPREAGGWYRTEDRWVSETAHAAFLRTHREAYEALDRACATLTLDERRVG